MSLRWRRIAAHAQYLRGPLRQLLPQLSLLLAVLISGAFAFHHLYEAEPLSFLRALYITWALVFMEHLLDFPTHPLLQVYYFVVPLLGLVVILDGIIRTSYHILRRDETSLEWVLAMTKTYSRHVILVGLGKVGLRTLQQLLKLDEEVVVVERDPECPHLHYARERGVPVVIGNHRMPELWKKLGTDRARALICATDDDLANLEMAIDARKLNPTIRAVLRMFDQELAEKIKSAFDLHLAFSTSEIAAPLFATAASDRSILSSFYVGRRLFVVARIEVQAESKLASMRVADMSLDRPIVILEHERGAEERFFPGGDVQLEAGDLITLQSDPDCLNEVHEWNRVPTPVG